jgi:hypothetical protein
VRLGRYVFGVGSCFVISNVVAGKARRDAPSASRILSRVLSVGMPGYSLGKASSARSRDGCALHYNMLLTQDRRESIVEISGHFCAF